MGLFHRRHDDEPITLGPPEPLDLLTPVVAVEADIDRTVATWLAPWPTLTGDEQERLLDLTAALLDGLRWEAANGFELTEEICIVIAAHAAMLALGLPDDLEQYVGISSVIVHPSTFVRRGPRHVGDGIFSDADDPLIGEAHHHGPVLISWDAAAQQAREPWRGENVIYHEFAHQLDHADGVSDGTPIIRDRDEFRRFVRACTASMARLRAAEEASVLRSYGATNPAEFFAVATEVFFTRPQALRLEDADLYRALAEYFGQDPALRRPLPGPVFAPDPV